MKSKKVFTALIFAILNLSVSGQGHPVSYTEVVELENISADVLFKRAKVWFATAYNSANDVIQLDDDDTNQIIGKATMQYNPTILYASKQTGGRINYTIKVFVKEGRYKYIITDFIHDPQGYNKIGMGLITTEDECPNPAPLGKKGYNKIWKDVKNQIEDNTSLLISDLKKGMMQETISDDW